LADAVQKVEESDKKTVEKKRSRQEIRKNEKEEHTRSFHKYYECTVSL
jgi:hypothetical protein